MTPPSLRKETPQPTLQTIAPKRQLKGRRKRVTDATAAFRAAVAAARGAGQRGQASASQALNAAHAELALLRDQPIDPQVAAALTGDRLEHVVESVQLRRAKVFSPWLGWGPQAVTEAFNEGAPGSAGEPSEHWLGQVGKVDGTGEPAQLWRIGQGWVAGLPAQGFPVAVPLLDDTHLQITADPDVRHGGEALIEGLLLRVLSHYRPGLVRVHVWDAGQHAGTLPGLYPLTQDGLLTIHPPEGLARLLEQMADRITRIRTSVLVGGHPTLHALAATAGGERVEPWHLVVLVGDGTAWRDQAQAQLQRVARAGLACGIHLVTLNVPDLTGAVESVRVTAAGTQASSLGPYVQIRLDPATRPNKAHQASRAIASWWAEWIAREASFTDLLPPADRWGKSSAAGGLVGPVGFDEHNEPVHAALGDGSPHALICGPSGSGKTNLILTLLATLSSRYSPDELALYLLDFKEGVSFAQLGHEHGDPTWLPHARLVGVNINEDREFGLALLQFLADEMRRRAAAAKQHGVTKLEELRAADPDGHWPRIVAVIDEFQILFGPGEVAKQAIALLEDIARRGRSQGIHLVLASQDIGGIQIFWGRPGVWEQFVLRIGLPRATRVMDRLNDACAGLRRYHAVINHESGVRHANEIARVPNAVEPGSFDLVQQRLHDTWNADREPPVLFDGSRPPGLAGLIEALPEGLHAAVGQTISVTGRPASVALTAEPGRNLAVIGGSQDAPTVLAAAAVSLSGRAPDTQFAVVPLAAMGARFAEWAAARIGVEPTDPNELPALLDHVAGVIAERHADPTTARPPVLLALFGADAIEPLLGRPGLEALRSILRRGPEVGVHTLGWWRSTQRLRNLLTMGASVDDIGSWVALDVHGSELGSLIPGLRVNSWYPRPGRGLWLDRSRHAQPEVIFTPSLEES